MVLEGSHSPPLTGLWQCSCEENAEKKKKQAEQKQKQRKSNKRGEMKKGFRNCKEKNPQSLAAKREPLTEKRKSLPNQKQRRFKKKIK